MIEFELHSSTMDESLSTITDEVAARGFQYWNFGNGTWRRRYLEPCPRTSLGYPSSDDIVDWFPNLGNQQYLIS